MHPVNLGASKYVESDYLLNSKMRAGSKLYNRFIHYILELRMITKLIGENQLTIQEMEEDEDDTNTLGKE